MCADRHAVGIAVEAEFVDGAANLGRFEVVFVAQDDARTSARPLQHDVVLDLQVENADQAPVGVADPDPHHVSERGLAHGASHFLNSSGRGKKCQQFAADTIRYVEQRPGRTH